MKQHEITLIKLGGSIITDKSKPYTFRPEIVRRLAKEIKKANMPVILFHGSGSFGHTSAVKYGGKKGYKSRWGIAKVSRDAMEINRLVMDILIEEKLPAVSLRPMSMMLSNEGKIVKEVFDIVPELLSQGIIPVMYGDVIWDKKWKSTIYSGETTLSALANYLTKMDIGIKKIIQVGITDGVHGEQEKTIAEITSKNYKSLKKHLFDSKSADVTGGMQHKIESALVMNKKGIQTVIINGLKAGNLYKVITNKIIGETVIS